jgi:hypothetical protein
MRVFFYVIGALALLRILIGFVTLPLAVLPVVNGLLVMVYLAAPILAIFFAADHPWRPSHAVAFLVGGLAVWGGMIALDVLVLGRQGPISGVARAVQDAGLATWCVGLGALLATLVRDKNILIPIAIFLAIYDAFLVLTPVGPTAQFLEHMPEVLHTGGMSVPAVADRPTGGRAAISATVGPADLVFLGAFFIALFRFRMRTEATLRWTLPALIVYMVLVGLFGIPLPALIPIGIVLVAVNWREFRLTRDEKISTAVVVVIGLALLAWGLTRPRPAPPPEPAPIPGARVPDGPPGPTAP